MFDINRLDKDLIDKIYGYIHYPQPQSLLRDIENFYETKNRLYEFYTIQYSHEPDEVENWIYNDIISYFNDDIPIMIEYTDNYIDKINRGYLLHTKEKIIKYIEFCDSKKDIKSLINIYLSKLSVREREQILHQVILDVT
jgi:hypothetical protein